MIQKKKVFYMKKDILDSQIIKKLNYKFLIAR